MSIGFFNFLNYVRASLSHFDRRFPNFSSASISTLWKKYYQIAKLFDNIKCENCSLQRKIIILKYPLERINQERGKT
jgi:hypothetical protein